MAMSAEQLGEAVVAAKLLLADQVRAVWKSLPAGERPKDGAALAQALVAAGLITEFQAQHLLAGKGAALVLGDYVIQHRIGAGAWGRCSRPCIATWNAPWRSSCCHRR